MTLRGPFLPEHNLALFLDIDGTLLEIAPTPDAVVVPAALRNTLQLASAREQGALALVSGRSLAAIDRLFRPLVLPAAGLHGAERRGADGAVTRPQVDQCALDQARAALVNLARRYPGVLLEDKGACMALHYRAAPRCEPEVRAQMVDIAADLGDSFVLRKGKCVLELAPAGASKRTAVEAFMHEEPFSGRVPVFIGDDITDEDGFAAVNAMGGHSVRVGSPMATQARHSFATPSAVVAWLRERNVTGQQAGRPQRQAR
jgi:trehalose 6-phosphate phosphatase